MNTPLLTPTLFLDIDGVLLPGYWLAQRHGYYALCTDSCKTLFKLLQEVKPELVLSSTWRRHHDLPDMEQILAKWGCPYPLTSYTPVLQGQVRGIEIEQWLLANPKDRSIAILDDDDDMAFLKPYLVQTEFQQGLTEEHIPQLRKLLTQNEKPVTVPILVDQAPVPTPDQDH